MDIQPDTQQQFKVKMINFRGTFEDEERLAVIAKLARRSKSDVMRLLIEDTYKRLQVARPQEMAMEAQMP